MFVVAVFLQGLELGGVLFEVVAEAALLESEIAEVSAERHEDFGVDQSLTIVGIFFIGEQVGEFAAADGVEAGLERSDAEKTPFGIGDGLDERFFFVGGGREFGEVAVKLLLISEGVVGR